MDLLRYQSIRTGDVEIDPALAPDLPVARFDVLEWREAHPGLPCRIKGFYVRLPGQPSREQHLPDETIVNAHGCIILMQNGKWIFEDYSQERIDDVCRGEWDCFEEARKATGALPPEPITAAA